jgi:hypothetical protein
MLRRIGAHLSRSFRISGPNLLHPAESDSYLAELKSVGPDLTFGICTV